jgi:HD-like signal output (HDOD) protein
LKRLQRIGRALRKGLLREPGIRLPPKGVGPRRRNALSTAIRTILNEIKSLEPLPQIAMRVAEIAAKEDVVPRDLVSVIETDAGVTGKVLKLCNSAFYGFSREIASLSEASNLLGVTTLVNLVVTSCASRYFRNYGKSRQKSAEALWERSVMNALAASRMARLNGRVDVSRAYTAGLLQNVGLLVFDRFLHAELPRVRVELDSGKSILDAEEAVFGMHHAEIGARLAEQWNLPPILADTIRYHHTPECAKVDRELAGVAHLGEEITTTFCARTGLELGTYEFGDSELAIAGIARDRVESIHATLTADLEKARDFIMAA